MADTVFYMIILRKVFKILFISLNLQEQITFYLMAREVVMVYSKPPSRNVDA